MKKKKAEERKKLTKIVLVIIITLSIFVLALLLIQQGILEDIKRKMSEPKLFEIEDECSLILNRIIHKIKNEGECKITCRNECGLRKMNFYSSEFIEKENACHTCNCYCK